MFLLQSVEGLESVWRRLGCKGVPIEMEALKKLGDDERGSPPTKCQRKIIYRTRLILTTI